MQFSTTTSLLRRTRIVENIRFKPLAAEQLPFLVFCFYLFLFDEDVSLCFKDSEKTKSQKISTCSFFVYLFFCVAMLPLLLCFSSILFLLVFAMIASWRKTIFAFFGDAAEKRSGQATDKNYKKSNWKRRQGLPDSMRNAL